MIKHDEKHLNPDRGGISEILQSAISGGVIREEDTCVIFYDMACLEYRLKHLISCFPSGTLHGLAIKANPLTRIMNLARSVGQGIGVETASIGEVNLALHAGYLPAQIVFDSPVKTPADIKFSLAAGIHLNIDNLSELERVSTLYNSSTQSSIGLRINPQIGLGTILESSVAGEYSKFGVPLKSRHTELEKDFLTYPWLIGVHLHVGSQGCSLDMLTEGIGRLYDFVMEMNPRRIESGLPPISVFDIGGGLPVSYHSGTVPPAMENYVNMISARAPELFNPASFRLITEFGRWTYTNTGWTVSRVEYVKHDPMVKTVMIHAGADLFVRECLNPRDWSHDYTVYDSSGKLKTGQDEMPYNLAGPLCFSGDILAKNVSLPVVEEGDYIVIHDTGSYTFSMWSRYNSRQTPRIAGYRDGTFEILKEREKIEDLVKFWA